MWNWTGCKFEINAKHWQTIQTSDVTTACSNFTFGENIWPYDVTPACFKSLSEESVISSVASVSISGSRNNEIWSKPNFTASYAKIIKQIYNLQRSACAIKEINVYVVYVQISSPIITKSPRIDCSSPWHSSIRKHSSPLTVSPAFLKWLISSWDRLIWYDLIYLQQDKTYKQETRCMDSTEKSDSRLISPVVPIQINKTNTTQRKTPGWRKYKKILNKKRRELAQQEIKLMDSSA